MHELPIAEALAAAGHDAIAHGESGDRNAEPGRGQAKQRLVGVGGDFANVGRAEQESGRVAAVGRPVGVAHDQGDGFRPDTQFLGDHLRIKRAHAGAGFGAAGARQNRIVVADFEPGGEQRGV